jgi:hypothetical protein
LTAKGARGANRSMRQTRDDVRSTAQESTLAGLHGPEQIASTSGDIYDEVQEASTADYLSNLAIPFPPPFLGILRGT